MARDGSAYICQTCGAVHPKWAGQCTACNAWNSLVEERTSVQPGALAPSRASKTRGLNFETLETEQAPLPRILTGVEEFDRVCGGGVAQGSAILLAGDPGVGKSTLLLQVCASAAARGARCAYISGEEAVVALLDPLIQGCLAPAAVLATSVVARGGQRGRLYVFSSRAGYCWSDSYRRHLQLVADLCGVALENDLLRQDRRRHERLDRQLSIGAEIQAQLLPDSCPVIEGVDLAACCRPAFQVGGDYYDFIPVQPDLIGRRREQGHWALVMGVVMGKGVPAGLLMTLLDSVMAGAARTVVEDDHGMMTVDMQVAFLAPGRGTLTGMGKVLRKGSLIYVEGTVTDEAGNMVCRASGMFKPRRPPKGGQHPSSAA